MEDFFLFVIFEAILNFVGGTIRWFYGSIWRTIFNKPKFKYSEYLFGPEKNSTHYDEFAHHFNNKIIGGVFIFAVTILSIAICS
ncbi:hypothetical protein [Tenacibaculum adriaticum]|uniref:hypothetical protein n=1 Tax=Tenacibaculum adriaticum TaxID=413713 RepID=UPI0011E7D8CD|nr:hypothetical protein [Tenacibaculum adriaticum]